MASQKELTAQKNTDKTGRAMNHAVDPTQIEKLKTEVTELKDNLWTIGSNLNTQLQVLLAAVVAGNKSEKGR